VDRGARAHGRFLLNSPNGDQGFIRHRRGIRVRVELRIPRDLRPEKPILLRFAASRDLTLAAGHDSIN
jgi:hypothetical protein